MMWVILIDDRDTGISISGDDYYETLASAMALFDPRIRASVDIKEWSWT